MKKTLVLTFLMAMLLLSTCPSIALATQPDAGGNDEGLALQVAATKKYDTVSGSGWKIALPRYWYRRAGKTLTGGNGRGCVLPLKNYYGSVIPYGDEPVLNWEVVSASEGKRLLKQGKALGTVRLKTGQRVKLRYNNPYNGYMSFTARLKSGKYLNVSAYSYVGYTKTHTKLQTLGHTSRARKGGKAVVKALLKHIAGRTSVSR